MAAPEQASLEKIVETGLVDIETLHPGGLALAEELAAMCKIEMGAAVLDVACGTGETDCFLSERRGARVIGLDVSPQMTRRAQQKARSRGREAAILNADAQRLPFRDACFEVVICECTLCLLNKRQALAEMVRVVRPGGRVGMHDLCWRADAPERMKRTLAEIEGETPETLQGWQRLFADAGLSRIDAVDKSHLIPAWMKESKTRLGESGQLKLFRQVLRRWGVRGVWRILQTEKIFSSDRLGYGIVAGTKPA